MIVSVNINGITSALRQSIRTLQKKKLRCHIFTEDQAPQNRIIGKLWYTWKLIRDGGSHLSKTEINRYIAVAVLSPAEASKLIEVAKGVKDSFLSSSHIGITGAITGRNITQILIWVPVSRNSYAIFFNSLTRPGSRSPHVIVEEFNEEFNCVLDAEVEGSQNK